tara:strand:+ start:1359 stop:1784 length:426 start_codon:yes stop_codon:yes gene_type:complete
MGLHKIFKIIALILSLVGVVFFALLLSKGDDAVRATGEGLDGFLYVAYIIFALIILMVVIFVLKGIFSGDIKKTLLSVGLFLAIVVISYVLADGTEVTMRDGEILSASGSKWVSTGLYVFYIMAFLAIASMVFSGITKIRR